MAITCPDCGRTSHHLNDERFRYCGYCREFKGDPDWVEIARRTPEDHAIFAKLAIERPMRETTKVTDKVEGEVMSLPRWAETDDPVELGLRCVSVATAALMSANNDDNDRFHDGMFALRAIGDLFVALRSLRVIGEKE